MIELINKISIIQQTQKQIHMKNNETQKSTTHIVHCKACGREISIPQNYEQNTINCPACGYCIEKEEWQSAKPDSI